MALDDTHRPLRRCDLLSDGQTHNTAADDDDVNRFHGQDYTKVASGEWRVASDEGECLVLSAVLRATVHSAELCASLPARHSPPSRHSPLATRLLPLW